LALDAERGSKIVLRAPLVSLEVENNHVAIEPPASANAALNACPTAFAVSAS
jgi:hypothetical protein